MYLNKIKISQPYTKDDILKLKRQLIYDENIILGIKPFGFAGKHIIHDCLPLEHSQIDYITYNYSHITQKVINDGKIQEVYFHLLDLYKYQRNFTNSTVESMEIILKL